MAGSLKSRYGAYLQAEMGDYEGAKEAFDEALTIAKQHNDIALQMNTLVNAARTDYYQLRYRDCFEKARQALDLAPQVNDIRAEVEAYQGCYRGLLSSGELIRAQEQMDSMLPLTARLRDRYWLQQSWLNQGTIQSLMGNWRAARDSYDRVPSDAVLRTLGRQVLLVSELGETNQRRQILREYLDAWALITPEPSADYAGPAWMIPAIARITSSEDARSVQLVFHCHGDTM